MNQPTLTSAERRRLKGLAQTTDAILHVGKNGVTPAFIAGMDAALKQHGLVKIRFIGFKEEKQELARAIAAESASALVQVVGNVAVFYRPRKSE